MTLRESAQLRQLVNDYYHGLITSESYRAERASLLDNIGLKRGNDINVTATRTRSELHELAHSPTVQSDAPARSPSSAWKSIAIGIVAIGTIATVGYFGLDILGGRGTSGDVSPSSRVVEQSSPGDALVDGFLTKNDWSKEAVNNFILAWEALDGIQQMDVAEGRQYRRLTSQLHQRIREELALGSAFGDHELSSLMNFAELIGVPYRRSDASEKGEAAEPYEEPEAPAYGGEVDEVERDKMGGEELGDSTDASSAKKEDVGLPVNEAVESGTNNSEPASSGALATGTDTMAQRSDPCTPELANTRRPYCRDILLDGSKGPALVILPKGSFEMGSDRFDQESPKRQVSITRQFAMSVYEVSVGEFLLFCAAAGRECPVSQSVDDEPVVFVSWDEAMQYTNWLTKESGFKYRLPSEAEWEYAARAGTQTPYFFGDKIAPASAHWLESGSLDAPLPRSQRTVNRNSFRLYHMSGNVREWVQDSWFADYESAPADASIRVDPSHQKKVVRGGSYQDPAHKLRSAAREPLDSNARDSLTGFRIVREIVEESATSHSE